MVVRDSLTPLAEKSVYQLGKLIKSNSVKRHGIAVFLIHNIRQQLQGAETVREHSLRDRDFPDGTDFHVCLYAILGLVLLAGNAFHHFCKMPPHIHISSSRVFSFPMGTSSEPHFPQILIFAG